jgi:GNAT superfamily N-acetyltransferase
MLQRLPHLSALWPSSQVGVVDLSRAELLLPSHQLNPSGAYVCALSVSRPYRRLGVGRRLMELAEALARGSGADAGEQEPLFGAGAAAVSEFWLHVEAGGGAARALYEGLGYEEMPDGERRCVCGGVWGVWGVCSLFVCLLAFFQVRAIYGSAEPRTRQRRAR